VSETAWGKALRKIRREKGLSLEALAKKCDMNFGHIGDIERGDIERPGIDLVFKLCTGLEITPNDLFIEAGLLAVNGTQEAVSPPQPNQPASLDGIATELASFRRDLTLRFEHLEAQFAELRATPSASSKQPASKRPTAAKAVRTPAPEETGAADPAATPAGSGKTRR